MKLTVYSDGAARNNPGQAGLGVVVKDGHKVVAEIAEYLGKTTNNVAEYLAFIRGLEEALTLGAEEVSCFADSELLVRQINGDYKVKDEGLVPLYHHALALIGKFKRFEIDHLPREKNKAADALSNKAIDDHHASTRGPLFGTI
ncbi:MAG: ribonuclease HI family protein [Candidatus Saganbacteria bacterium]|nr:ribonuclease HI family protein [Candidatus Saganbacteria bacterium]